MEAKDSEKRTPQDMDNAIGMIVHYFSSSTLFLYVYAINWFSAPSKSWGYLDFVTLSDLNNASGGLLVNDSIIVEAQITLISYPKDL
ncbi:hypothetical protein Vadar_032683 [Vaccinium darrowii]|uniref:Uncharacterized protein n=1 Tax=Vaccinium darrowii TaxID=229202 RepID=A0ACB7X690_9ERIC|nr:hypothetical protein Vadar_032683 [Vaccinium darrowii]